MLAASRPLKVCGRGIDVTIYCELRSCGFREDLEVYGRILTLADGGNLEKSEERNNEPKLPHNDYIDRIVMDLYPAALE